MFDKLIESNSAEAEFKPRRKFFMVSSVVVGILFITAVVASLYAQDLNLGTDNFELVEMLAPVEPDAPQPEPPRQQQQQQNQDQESDLPTRRELIARNDQPPPTPPDTISTTRNTSREMPVGPVRIDPVGPEGDGSRGTGPVGLGGGSSSDPTETTVAETPVKTEPPPVAKAEPKKNVIKSKGVINGEAIELPKPPFPAVAVSMNLSGTVNVQVLIDESGKVISAKAIDGHPFFRSEAEKAARRARFKPTILSDQPIKVTGVIVYRFMR